MKPITWFNLFVATILTAAVLCPPEAQAQLPGRFYWRTLTDSDAVPLIFNSISGNTNPFSPDHMIVSTANIDANVAIASYAHTFSLFDRSAAALVLVPMGNVSGDVTVAGKSLHQATNGYGDPMVEFNMNIIGPSAQDNLAKAMRYEPGFSVDVLVDLALPIGQYNSNQALNLGQNRWYGRLGAPINVQIGPWVPGRRTTLEFLPAVWIFGKNNDLVGQTLKTDPMFQLDAHLTRDFTEHFWGSIDGQYYSHGKNTINGVSADGPSIKAYGFTLGYQINENINLTAGYKSTLNNDNSPGNLRMDSFMFTLVFGWNKLVEGARRLSGAN
ncbi:MAG: transporter [Rhodocyclaceae bacterium]|nr:transporter [Rhodocyclaceae bacterium]